MTTRSAFELVPLKSGHTSLRSVFHGETFHPVTGPKAEAQTLYVDQQNLIERIQKNTSQSPYIIWDVGLGAAANALTAIEVILKEASEYSVELHSFDHSLEPLLFALENAEALNYLLPHRQVLAELLSQKSVNLSSNLQWKFHAGDFKSTLLTHNLPSPQSIFYDPYSPIKNQDMWTLTHFRNLFLALNPSKPCMLTNYTRSTAVRVTLLLAGFYVGIGTATGEKSETTVATNDRTLLKRPLDSRWLERVQRSQNSAPLRGTTYSKNPIGPEDLDELHRHPQFG